MKNLLITIGICLCCLQLKAGDTLFHKNGNISYIRKSYGTYTTFYENGIIERKVHRMGFLRLGKIQEYDSTGGLTAEGKTFYERAHRKWKYYQNEKLVETKNFRYGIIKDSLRNSEGKKVKCLLAYGKPMRRASCQSVKDRYKVMTVSVAGCMVTSPLIFRTSLHNFRIQFWKSLRYGFNWQEDMQELCNVERKAAVEITSP